MALLVVVGVPVLRPIVVGVVADKQVLPAERRRGDVSSFNTGDKFNKFVESCKKYLTENIHQFSLRMSFYFTIFTTVYKSNRFIEG